MMLDQLLDRRLLFVTGKGGVGKSTTTAGLAHALARAGKRTLVLETDAFSAMEAFFDFQSDGLEPVSVRENLWASNLDAEECFIATLKRFVPGERVARAVIKNRIARVFFRAAPSVNEVTILDQVRVFFEKENPDGSPFYDHIVVDLPASGHAVTFLNVPATMTGMMRGRGPIAKMTAQVSELIADPAITAIVAVCLPEEMPVQETIELAARLKEVLGRPLDLAMVNMVHPSPLEDDQRELFRSIHEIARASLPGLESLFFEDADDQSAQATAMARVIEGNALAQGWHERDKSYLDILDDRLDVPVIKIPTFYEANGADVVNKVARFLHGQHST